jgi:hypothetical protein
MSPYNLQPSQQRRLALAILFAALLLGLLVVILPIRAGLALQHQRLGDLKTQILKWERVVASGPGLDLAREEWARTAERHGAFIPTASDSQAGASLQAFVRRIFQNAGTDIKSLEPMPVQDVASIRRVGVRVIALASQAQLDQILEHAWHHEPALMLETVTIKGVGSGRLVATGSHQPSLQIEFEIHAMMDPSGDPS